MGRDPRPPGRPGGGCRGRRAHRPRARCLPDLPRLARLRRPARSAMMPTTMADDSGQRSRRGPESVQTTIPIAEAATRLGISPDAVRKRIARGKLAGHKADNGWYVVWTESDIRPESVQTPVRDDPLVDSLRDHLARQQDEITFLREQLDHSRRELAE